MVFVSFVACALLCTCASASDLSKYAGVRVQNDKALLQFGEAGDVTLYRTGAKAANFDGSLRMVNGEVQFTSTSTACTSAKAGSVKFDSKTKRLLVCTGSHWEELSSSRRLDDKQSGSTSVVNMMTAMMEKIQSIQSSCSSSGGAVWVTRNRLPKMPTNTGGTSIRIIMRGDIRALKYQCVWSTVASHKVLTLSTNAKYDATNQWDCPIPKWPNPSQSPFALFLKVREVHGGSSDYAKQAYADVPFRGAQPLDGKVMIKAIAPTMKFDKVDFNVNNAETYAIKFSVQDADHDLLSLKFTSSCGNKKVAVVYSTPNKAKSNEKLITFNFKAAGKTWTPFTCAVTIKDSSGLSAAKTIKLSREPPKPQCSHFYDKNGMNGGKDLKSSITGGQIKSNFVLKILMQTGGGNFCNSGWRGLLGGDCHTFGLWFNGGLRNERQCGPHPGHSIIPCNKFKAGTKYWIQIVRSGGSGTMTIFSVAGDHGMGSKVAEKKYNIGYATYTRGIQTVGKGGRGGEKMTGKIFCLDFKNT